MFDFSMLMAGWEKAIAYHGPSAEEANFVKKLSHAGVKAPFGTPPAKTQLAKSLAMVQPDNGGSGNFMGKPLDDNGMNAQAVKAQLVVGKNMAYNKADFLVDKFYKGA